MMRSREMDDVTCGSAGCDRRVCVCEPRPLGKRLWVVERARYPLERRTHHVGVHHGGSEVRVAGKSLYRPDVAAVLEEVSSEGMAE